MSTGKLTARRRAAGAALGVSMLLGIGGVALAPPASAAYTDCPSTYVCGWVDKAYGGARAQFLFDAQNFTYFTQSGCASGTWNDCISSVYMRKQYCEARFYNDANYGGGNPVTYGYLAKQSLVPRNDMWSSVRVYCP